MQATMATLKPRQRELGAKLLESVGLSPDMITAPAIQAAIEANDVLVSRLEQIAQDAGHQEE